MGFSHWRYRRMAWKNDPALWMEMHPRAAIAIDKLENRFWPFRRWALDMLEAARDYAKVQAIKEVYGDTGEIKHWKYDGNATDIRKRAKMEAATREERLAAFRKIYGGTPAEVLERKRRGES